MKESLQPGLISTTRVIVTKDMSPAHLPTVVLSTPTMVGLIEGACLQLAGLHLDENETTVGTHVCVSHAGAAYENDEVTIRVKLTEIRKRRLTFEETVTTERGTISEGTHQRAVIDTSKFA